MRNFKQIRRRGLPLLLALVMCLSLVQVPAFAEEGAVPSDYPEILQETAGEPGSSENSESQKQPEIPEISDSTENTGTPAASEDPEAPAAPAAPAVPAVPENPEGPDAAGTGEETSEEDAEGNDPSDTEDILPEEVQAFLDAVDALWDQADSDDAEAMLAAVEEAEELYGVLTGEQKELPQVQQCRAALDAFWETVTLEENEPVTVTTEAQLRDAVAEGGEVKLGEDITGNITIAEDRNVTLDLNGHNLYYGNESGYDYHTIIVKGTLILKDSQGGGGLVRMEGDNRIQRRVKVEETGNFTLESGTISGAFGTAFGAIWVAGGKLTMTGGEIVNNSGTSGGGVYLNSNGTFIMTGGEIVDNSSIDGGGVYLTGDGTFIMDNGTITGNTAKDYGGGVCLIWAGKGSITINGGTISNNGAGQLGGGIASYRPVTINGGNILDNSASNLGGGIFSWSNITIHGGVISGNGKERTINGKNFSLTRFGGGINTSDAPVLTITDGEISDNEAEYGGGICMGECSLIWPHPRECDESDPGNIIRMTGGKIINNKATLGGGVKADRCWVRPVKFYFEGGEISGNEADKGGGVYVDPGSLLEMSSNDSRITKNRANLGGGVYVEGITAKNSLVHGIFRLKAGHITGNEATDGGGVYASPNANIIINQEGNISSNKATRDGGGVYIASKEIDVVEFDLTAPDKYEETKKEVGSQLVAATMNMSGGTISDNTASNGGGVYMDGGTFTMTGGDVSSNIAPKPKNDGHGCAGAGVYMNGGVFTMSNSTISGNHATGETSTTGGVSLNNGAKFTMTNSRITGNIADRHQAGGVLVGGNCSFIMESGTINGNECRDGGGGVSVNGGSGASFLMKGGTISGNTVNNGLAMGGGVSVLSGKFTMENGTIENNTAINNGDSNPQYELKGPQLGLGGGVSVAVGGTFTMKNGVIRGNTVTGKVPEDQNVGGGGGVAVIMGSSFTMENGTITGNTAKANDGETAPYSGGGVYVDNSTFTRSGGILCNNTAETAGADVYAAGATVTLGDISKEGWMLTVGDAGHHKITGWFQDTADTRWACDAPTAEHTTYDAQTAPAGGLFLKAAHGILCRLTVKYVNEQREEISSTVIEQDKGSQYTVTPKAPDGYEIKEIQGNTSGTLDENKEIVVICYQPKVTVTWRNGYNDTPVKVKDDHQKGAAVAS